MSAVATRGEADESLGRFRRLTGVTIVATLVLVLIGGIVRVSDSGLGCGPGGQRHARLAALRGRRGARGLLGVDHRVLAPDRRDRGGGADPRHVRDRRGGACATARGSCCGSVAAGVLVLAQAGARRPDRRGGPPRVPRGRPPRPRDAPARPADRPAARRQPADRAGRRHRAGCARRRSPRACWCWRRSSPAASSPAPRARASPREPVLGAHTACGEQFPGCLDRFMPFGEDRLVDIQLTHRGADVPGRDRRARDDRDGAAPGRAPAGVLGRLAAARRPDRPWASRT